VQLVLFNQLHLWTSQPRVITLGKVLLKLFVMKIKLFVSSIHESESTVIFFKIIRFCYSELGPSDKKRTNLINFEERK
jgi:hypothetical protein